MLKPLQVMRGDLLEVIAPPATARQRSTEDGAICTLLATGTYRRARSSCHPVARRHELPPSPHTKIGAAMPLLPNQPEPPAFRCESVCTL